MFMIQKIDKRLVARVRIIMLLRFGVIKLCQKIEEKVV